MTRKTTLFEGWSWFKFNNLGLALGTNLKFYTSMSKELQFKVRKFWKIILTFVDVAGEKLVGDHFGPPILNRVKSDILQLYYTSIFPSKKLVATFSNELLELTKTLFELSKISKADLEEQRLQQQLKTKQDYETLPRHYSLVQSQQ